MRRRIPRFRHPDGSQATGRCATTSGGGHTGPGSHRTCADMPAAHASLKRRIVAGEHALLTLVPSGLPTPDPPPPPPAPPPPPPVTRPVPPPPPHPYTPPHPFPPPHHPS